jgi:hypothetical protein
VGKEQRNNEEKKELRRRTFPVPYSVQNYLDIIGKLEFSVVFVLSYKVYCYVIPYLSSYFFGNPTA